MAKIIHEAEGVDGLGELVERIPASTKPVTFTVEQIVKKLIADGFITADRASAIRIAEKIRAGIAVPDADSDFLVNHFNASNVEEALGKRRRWKRSTPSGSRTGRIPKATGA